MSKFEPKRVTDTPENLDAWRTDMNQFRWRTIFWSAIVAGLVALVVVRISEVQTFNEQADRNRKNCQLLQDDRRDRARDQDNGADRVLGNSKKDIKPFKFKGTAFEEFEPLSIALAQEQRRQAQRIRDRIENCDTVFPKRDTFPIIG